MVIKMFKEIHKWKDHQIRITIILQKSTICIKDVNRIK